MKINPLDNRSGIIKSGTEKKSADAGETFDAILDDHLKNSVPSGTPASDGTVVRFNTSSELAGTGFLRADSVKKAEGLLFSLDMYKNSLANTDIKPERLSELLDDMKEKSADALKSGHSLPADDPLRDILAEVRTLITDESRRFYSAG